ncbi:helix-turn-helix domain-containing protein, partial [Cupriavidus sp. amp6]|uniref:helix-turn-helix domain-containing protein n=2 Tax=Cupriavidus sp. amp6 TaxID=388051 RepID=UPI00055FFEF9
MTKKKYRQQQPEERMRIEIWKAEQIGVRDMAFRLGRSPSTISRELARNTCHGHSYRATVAHASRTRRRDASRPAAKLDSDGVLWGVVRHFLELKWSPQE